MTELPGWATNAELRREMSDRQIQRLAASDELTRVVRGKYVATSAWAALSVDDRTLLRIATVAATLGPGAVMSHTSAARLHGLPTGLLQRDRPHATWSGSAGRGASTNVLPHSARLADDDMVIVGGIRTTSIERTLIDIARAADVRLAVAMTDVALRRGHTTPAGLDRAGACIGGRPGASRVREVFRFADVPGPPRLHGGRDPGVRRGWRGAEESRDSAGAWWSALACRASSLHSADHGVESEIVSLEARCITLTPAAPGPRQHLSDHRRYVHPLLRR